MEVILGKRAGLCSHGAKNEAINKTICDDSAQRQTETERIAKQVELMIIIGKKNNVEDNKLYETAIRECNNAMLVENIEELYLNYVRRFKKVGVMAGDEAPKDIIDKIVEILKNTKTEGYI